MSRVPYEIGDGPFRADDLRSGSNYELSQGHPVYCAPTGRDGTGPNGLGFAVLDSDPAVRRAGVDTGIKLADGTLRTPDVAVNFEDDDKTWARSAPLVVEYAGQGQDESDLRVKIRELLAGGTRWVWVVRLTGEPRVEVHEPGLPMQILGMDQTLTAPGVLALPVPVRALVERDAAHAVTLRNLLRARGIDDIDAQRERDREEGREEGRDRVGSTGDEAGADGSATSATEQAADRLWATEQGTDRLWATEQADSASRSEACSMTPFPRSFRT
jgi:hypothetical protein